MKYISLLIRLILVHTDGAMSKNTIPATRAKRQNATKQSKLLIEELADYADTPFSQIDVPEILKKLSAVEYEVPDETFLDIFEAVEGYAWKPPTYTDAKGVTHVSGKFSAPEGGPLTYNAVMRALVMVKSEMEWNRKWGMVWHNDTMIQYPPMGRTRDMQAAMEKEIDELFAEKAANDKKNIVTGPVVLTAAQQEIIDQMIPGQTVRLHQITNEDPLGFLDEDQIKKAGFKPASPRVIPFDLAVKKLEERSKSAAFSENEESSDRSSKRQWFNWNGSSWFRS